MKNFVAVFFFLFVSSVSAQTVEENSLLSFGGGSDGAGSCLYRDYQSIGVNPANLGIYDDDGDTRVNLGFFDAHGLFFSDALPKSEILPALFGRHHLSSDEKVSIAELFLESGNSFSAEVDPVNFAIQFPKLGGFGFSWRERFSGEAQFTQPLADLVFNGIHSQYIDTIIIDVIGQQIGLLGDYDAGSLFNGSSIKFSWLREFNLSYGRQLIGNDFLKIYLGGSVKFLQSNATADISFNADTISGFAAFSKLFNIDYANFTDPGVSLAGRFTPVGKGMGFDLGTTVSLGQKFFAAFSVTDIGSIKYTGNLVTINDAVKDSLINFFGINIATIFSDLDTLFNAKGFFHYLPAGEQKVNLPTQMRIGAAMHLTKQIDIGVDLIQPFNDVPGTIGKTSFAGLFNFSPSKNFKLSTGFVGGGISDFNIPVGISFSLVPDQLWQMSIGTGDIISWVKQNRPTISISLSLLRFHYE